MICYVRKGNNCVVINHPDIYQTRRDLNSFLPVNGSRGLFYKKSCFSPVKNVRKCRGRDLNSFLMAKNTGFLL
jgi:hypothetical protein